MPRQKTLNTGPPAMPNIESETCNTIVFIMLQRYAIVIDKEQNNNGKYRANKMLVFGFIGSCFCTLIWNCLTTSSMNTAARALYEADAVLKPALYTDAAKSPIIPGIEDNSSTTK